jgi:hypothetical protein
MRTWSPVLRIARLPPAAASGEALRIEGEPEVPDWRPSPMQASEVDALLDQVIGRPHVHDFGGARIADRAGAAHEQQGVLVDRRARGRRSGGDSPPDHRTPPPALEGAGMSLGLLR